MINTSRVILFVLLFIHLDNETIHPRNIMIINALIGIIGLFLYRRHISIKLCKKKTKIKKEFTF